MRHAAALARGALVALLALLAGRGAFLLLDRLEPFPAEGLDRFGASPRVFASDGTPMRVGLTGNRERLIPVKLRDVSPHLIRAVLAQEDRRFFDHAGVDVRSMLRAVVANLRGSRQGGSTLTMQLARLADPRPRTVWGKAVQAFRALQLEQHHGKQLILERYLNLVPFGGNLRGVGAAAHAWFGKRAADLTAAEAALLVSVLPSPSRYRPDRDPERALRRRNRLLAAMGLRTDAPLGLRPTPFPDLAPHAWLRAQEGTTSIDPVAQAAVERVAKRARAGNGIDGLAIVLVENETRAVRALVGAREPSARLLDASGRPRSAGSTLKPFLYALAFDLGLAAPQTRLLDLEWSSPEWEPGNFDQKLRGPVPAAEALAASYNLPAIRLAARLPRGALSGLLHRAGLSHVRESGPAIDLAIGTDDVTPMELAAAYAALAGGGEYEPVWLTPRRRQSTRVCSPAAAGLVARILSDPTRPRPRGAATRGIAWKTGTSSRRRDAWAAGFTRRYTAVVWRGRLDGAPHSSLVGARAATPLLFDVLQAVDPDPAPFGEPQGARRIETCAISGLRRTAACPKGAHDLAAGNLRPCAIHQRLPVSTDGFLLCARCRHRHEPEVREEDFAIYPPAHAHWRARAGLRLDTLPPHHPDCPDPLEPQATRPLLLPPETRGDRVAVRALSFDPSTKLTVLLDGVVVARAWPGETVELSVSPGPHTIGLVSRAMQASATVR